MIVVVQLRLLRFNSQQHPATPTLVQQWLIASCALAELA